MGQTPYSNRIDILTEFQETKVNRQQWLEFFLNNHLSISLAWLIKYGVVENTSDAESFINETFENLVIYCEHEGDTGFKTLAELIGEDFDD